MDSTDIASPKILRHKLFSINLLPSVHSIGRVMVSFTPSLVLLLAFITRSFGSVPASEIRNLTIPMGVLQGRPCPLVHNVTAYLGIPYALSPLANLRFRPSILNELPYPGGVFNATEFGTVCGTPCDNTGDFGVRKAIDEDCLNLNIWVPLNSENFGDMAVRVYIHGGMNTCCNGNDDIIDGCFSTQSTQSIAINLNYRLGGPGFLAHPQTFQESNTTGNWGLHDHQTALKWIKTYIHYFGGNASKILLYGGSSGASLVAQHVTIESSAGLFSAAVTQSATCYEALTLEEAYVQMDNISLTVGCPGDRSLEDLKCLRETSMESLSNSFPDDTSQVNCYAHGRFPVYSPVVDGNFLKEQLVEAMEAGRFNKVPLLVGSNRDEGKSFIEHLYDDYFTVTEQDLIEFLETIFLDANITELIALYPIEMYSNDTYPEYERFSVVLSDLLVRCPNYRILNARGNFPEVPLYSFMFFHTPSCPASSIYQGCTHASEVLFVFGNTINVYPPTGTCNFTEPEDRLSDSFMYAWTEMAKTGVPSLQYGAQFPLWDRAVQMTTDIDLTITFQPNDISTRCEAFQAIVDEYVQSGRPMNNRLKSTYGRVATE